MQTPFGPIVWRALDHQSTMGAYVGQLAQKDGKGVMVDWRYADGAEVPARRAGNPRAEEGVKRPD